MMILLIIIIWKRNLYKNKLSHTFFSNIYSIMLVLQTSFPNKRRKLIDEINDFVIDIHSLGNFDTIDDNIEDDIILPYGEQKYKRLKKRAHPQDKIQNNECINTDNHLSTKDNSSAGRNEKKTNPPYDIFSQNRSNMNTKMDLDDTSRKLTNSKKQFKKKSTHPKIDISMLLQLPLKDASELINMAPNTLSKKYTELTGKNWPYRELINLNKKMVKFQIKELQGNITEQDIYEYYENEKQKNTILTYKSIRIESLSSS